MNIFVSSIPSMLIVMIVIAGVCVILANKLTKNLMAPIEKVSNDLENAATIQSETEYKELVPFLNTISECLTRIENASYGYIWVCRAYRK